MNNNNSKFNYGLGYPDTSIGYTGYEYDFESTLYYAQARYYDATVGRFTAKDPWKGTLETPVSMNPYPYVLNNPLKYVDPLGLSPMLSEADLDDGTRAYLESIRTRAGLEPEISINEIMKHNALGRFVNNSSQIGCVEGTSKIELPFDYEVNHIHLDSVTLPTDEDGNSVIRRSGEMLQSVQSITIHSTANPNSYSDGERNWLLNPDNNRSASFHVVVDENKAIEVIPLDEVAIHASDYTGNRTSIGIEITHSGDRERTLQNAIVLTAKLLQDFELDTSSMLRHYDWNGKNCPSVLIDSSVRDQEHQTWEWFVSEVGKLLL